MNDCITCKKNNKGNNWRNCKLKCHYKYEQQKKDEIYKLQEENKQMKERLNNCEKFFNELGELLNEEVGNAYWTQVILHKIKKLIEINHELAEEHKTIGQDLYAEIKNYRKENEKLKEENARLKKIKDDFFKQAEISHQAVQDKNKIIEKLETVIQEIKQLVSTDYIKTKKQLIQNYDCLDNFMQKIEDKCNEVNQ